MGRSGAAKDQAGREFEALLAALPRKSTAVRPRGRDAVVRAPLGDAEFENLLDEFRGLGNPASPPGKSARGSHSPAVAENLVEMLEALSGERDRLVSRRDAIHDEAALVAIASLDQITTNLQIALMRDLPDKILLLRSGGQHFALPLAEVSRMLARDEVDLDEKKGARIGEEWLPARFLGACYGGKDAVVSDAAPGYVVIAAGPKGALALCVESAVGVVSATLAPLDAVLRGARGLKGMAITDTGVHAPVLDVNRLARKA